MPATMTNQHGEAIEWDGIGFLIVGPPNSGKSELALTLVTAHDAHLVADDQVLLDRTEQGVIATCPTAIKGMLHTRSGGFYTLPFIESTTIRFIVQSNIPAKPLSQPPKINTPIHMLDLRDPHIVTHVYELVTKYKAL